MPTNNPKIRSKVRPKSKPESRPKSESNIRIPYSLFAPEYKANSYSPKDALCFAIASEVAYKNSSDAKKRFKSWGFDHCEFFSVVRGTDIDTQGIVAKNDTHILAAFRGSESKADWGANFQAVKDPAPLDGDAHEGFQDAFSAATYEIGHSIGRLRDNNQQVWITGHSLGGALAVLLAATLLDAKGAAKIPVSGLYTFGSPRVGDKKFAKAFNQKMAGANFRVVNLEDMVPHLPPELLFSHVGSRILFDEDGDRSETRPKWVNAKEKMWGWIGKSIGSKRLVVKDAHLLASDIGYIAHLMQDLERSNSR